MAQLAHHPVLVLTTTADHIVTLRPIMITVLHKHTQVAQAVFVAMGIMAVMGMRARAAPAPSTVGGCVIIIFQVVHAALLLNVDPKYLVAHPRRGG